MSIALLFTSLCFWLNAKIIKQEIKSIRLKTSVLIFLNLVLIAFYVICLRGPYKHVAFNLDNYAFCEIHPINELSVNPLMAFSWAYKIYKNEQDIKPAEKEVGLALQKELFSLEQTSPKNTLAKELKPNVMLVILESLGMNALDFSQKDALLGSLGRHFEEDFLFTRFLSAHNHTLASLMNILIQSPIDTITQSKYQKYYLSQSPIELYKKQGYKIIFIHSGNASWKNMGAFLLTQGIDMLIDENSLIKDYPEAKATQNSYGIADEFLYKKAYEILAHSKEPLLIIALTMTNHPPYAPPKHPLKTVPKDMLAKMNGKYNSHEAIQAFAYANDEFGKFLDKFKASNFKNKSIIAATGDHRLRDLNIDNTSEKAFAYSVPFYLYVPQSLQENIYYDKKRIGSHKDIFPTLYALSLSEVSYLSLGGRNMLAKISDERLEFGFNASVWIDTKGIYPIGVNKGYFYENNLSLKDNNKAFELDAYRKNFAKSYQELDTWQFKQRLFKTY